MRTWPILVLAATLALAEPALTDRGAVAALVDQVVTVTWRL